MNHWHTSDAQEIIRQELDAAVARVWDLAAPVHAKPRLPYSGTGRDLAGGQILTRIKARPHILQEVHSYQYRARDCYPQGQYSQTDERQDALMTSYRRVLRDNLRRMFKAKGLSIKNPPACHYTEGPKKGRKVSQRTIQYIWDWDEGSTSPSPGLDVVQAVAKALDLHPWELLVPDLSPEDRPKLSTEQGIETQVSKRVADRMQTLQGHLSALLTSNGNRGSSTAANDGPDTEAPGTRKGRASD